MAPAAARNDRGLVVFGEFFLDLVFYDLPRAPRMGEEVKSRRFATFPGGADARARRVPFVGQGCESLANAKAI